MGHTKKTPLKGQRFESLEQAQAYLDRWEANWADTRIHGTTKRQVAAMFAEEKPTLLPLPVEPFRYYQYGERVVHLDGCVEVEAAYYGLPPGWIGRGVKVQWDELYKESGPIITGLVLSGRVGAGIGAELGSMKVTEQIDAMEASAVDPSKIRIIERNNNRARLLEPICHGIHERSGASVGVRLTSDFSALPCEYRRDPGRAAHV